MRVARPEPITWPCAFEPHLAGGITGQVAAVVVGQQRPQMQRGDARFDVEVHHDGGALPVRAGGDVASQPASTRLMNASRVVGSGGAGPDAAARRPRAVGAVGVVAFPLGDQRVAVGLQRGVERGGGGPGSVIRQQVNGPSVVLLIEGCGSGDGRGLGAVRV